MQPQEYNNLADKIWNDLKVIRDKKSHDYATDSDTLKNFKVTASILGGLGFQVKGEEIKSSDVAMFFEVIKLCRRANLRGRQPDNESVLDSVEDNVNYTCLQYACLVDENNQGKPDIQDEKDWVAGYQNWLNTAPDEPLLIEKPNWKVNGFWIVGSTYRSATDSTIQYEFLGKEPDANLYRFRNSATGNTMYYTELGLEELNLVEVGNV